MKILKIILISLVSLLISLLLFGWFIGFFKNMKVKEKEEGGFTVAGLKYTGPYSTNAKYMAQVEQKLLKLGIMPNREFGIYYDNPQTSSPENCRSYVGCIIREEDYDKIPELISTGLIVDTVPKGKAIFTEFSLRNSVSFMLGAMKAYPLMSKYLSTKGYKATMSIEIYDLVDRKITYLMQYE